MFRCKRPAFVTYNLLATQSPIPAQSENGLTLTISSANYPQSCCRTSLHAVKTFAQLGIPVEYTFSEISSSFLIVAKSKLGERNLVNFRTLDITEDFCVDLRDHYNIIIATNVIHATPNASRSARNARQRLRPGGFLTLIEYTQNLYLLDIIYRQLNGWWAFNDGREHAIMDENGWKTTLLRAGFEKID